MLFGPPARLLTAPSAAALVRRPGANGGRSPQRNNLIVVLALPLWRRPQPEFASELGNLVAYRQRSSPLPQPLLRELGGTVGVKRRALGRDCSPAICGTPRFPYAPPGLATTATAPPRLPTLRPPGPCRWQATLTPVVGSSSGHAGQRAPRRAGCTGQCKEAGAGKREPHKKVWAIDATGLQEAS